jgi:hypothetical protein
MKSKSMKELRRKLYGDILPAMRYPVFVYFLLVFPLCNLLHAGMMDRVAAYADNIAITLSELEAKYADTVKIKPDITKDEVLNTMINKALMLKEAKKIRLEAPSEDELLKEYIDLKVRAFIRIKDADVMDFYNKHFPDFKGKELEDVRAEIENYLIEKELNQRLKIHINELREKSCVKIQLNQGPQR